MLAYTSQPYAEVMAMRPSVSCTPYAKSQREQTGYIIMFTQFEKGGLLSETRNKLSKTCGDAESVKKYADNSTVPPLISKEEIDTMSSGNEPDDEPMSTEMLEDICNISQSHLRVNRR